MKYSNRRVLKTAMLMTVASALLAITSAASAGAHAPACPAFEYHGKPINPALVQEFEPLVSDDVPPITVKLNVSAAEDTNEYFNEPKKSEDGEIGYDDGDTHFAYRVIGCANGTYALRTFASSEGSGVFESLLLVRLSEAKAYDADGQDRSKQTFLTMQRRLSLGDRDGAKINLKATTLTVGPSRYRDKPLQIELGRAN